MAKPKSVYVCTACGAESGRWLGKCLGCGAWNTVEEQLPALVEPQKALKRAPGQGLPARLLSEIEDTAQLRRSSGIEELDRVLGGGIVEGSVVLMGGEPGVGKSTLLLQVSGALAASGARVLYVTGEESARQVKLRAQRLSVPGENLYIQAENALDDILSEADKISPDVMVVDSIQTIYDASQAASPGSVSQVRGCAGALSRFAKTTGASVFLVGHVTKEGAIAGPRVLEHMVDAVLYFEGDRQHAFRILRAVKNRYGSVNELGLFRMLDTGMEAVENPSVLLLSDHARDASGSVVACGLEGTRPLLVDLQALVARSPFAVPRRACDGLDSGRVALLLAVLEKRVGLKLYDQDVFLNVAGGLTLSEPAADLPLCLAVASSLGDLPLPKGTCAFGEVGLSGEVRPVAHADRRLVEAARQGFTACICPRDRALKANPPDGLKLYPVDTVAQAVRHLTQSRKEA